MRTRNTSAGARRSLYRGATPCRCRLNRENCVNCTDKTNRVGHVVQHALMIHEIPRLHAVLCLIHDIAAGPPRPYALADIARLARARWSFQCRRISRLSKPITPEYVQPMTVKCDSHRQRRQNGDRGRTVQTHSRSPSAGASGREPGNYGRIAYFTTDRHLCTSKVLRVANRKVRSRRVQTDGTSVTEPRHPGWLKTTNRNR